MRIQSEIHVIKTVIYETLNNKIIRLKLQI